MGKKKKDSERDIRRKDIDAQLYEMAMRYQRSNQSVEIGKADRYEELSAAARQMVMDDGERARWQQGLTEDMKYLILLIRQCLEENVSLRESVSGLRDDAAKEQKKAKRLKKELKRNKDDIANLSATVSDQGKCIRKLEGNFKDIQAVISYIGYLAGICIPDASSKKLRKAFENKFQLSFSKKKGSALLERMGE